MFFAYIVFTVLSFVSLFLQMNTVNEIPTNDSTRFPKKFPYFSFILLSVTCNWVLCECYAAFGADIDCCFLVISLLLFRQSCDTTIRRCCWYCVPTRLVHVAIGFTIESTDFYCFGTEKGVHSRLRRHSMHSWNLQANYEKHFFIFYGSSSILLIG